LKQFCFFAAVFLFAGGVFSANAQDLIALRNGDVIEARVTEISPSEVRYKRFDHLNGPTIVIPVADVLSIRYENGTVEIPGSAPSASRPSSPPPPAATPSQPPAEAAPSAPPQHAAPPAQAALSYEGFSTGERWGTWALNSLIPGVGSHVVMRDRTGVGVQWALFGPALLCYLIGGPLLISGESQYEVDNGYGSTHTEYRTNSNGIAGGVILALGGALHLSFAIYNIARSATYSRPVSTRRGSLADPDAWAVAVLPGKDGIEQVSLAYTLRF
jgi:hypothetical protein